LAPAGAPVSTGLISRRGAWSTAQPALDGPARFERNVAPVQAVRENAIVFAMTESQPALVADSVLNELAADAVRVRGRQAVKTTDMPNLSWDRVAKDAPMAVDVGSRERALQPGFDSSSGKIALRQAALSGQSAVHSVTDILFAIGFSGCAAATFSARSRRATDRNSKRQSLRINRRLTQS
jgi:hypothetical protein